MRHASHVVITALTLRALAAFDAPAQSAPEPNGDRPATVRPGEPVDFRGLAFNPERWAERKIDTRMVPWAGRDVVFLTTTPDLDPAVMARFLGRLDAGWRLYADLVGRTPRPFKRLDGKPTIAAVPRSDLTCGYGCGFIGLTGIEVAGFYAHDYPQAVRSPDDFSHYYFYEMGRNYYMFGDRHSQFITGYAVFMRYVCMDALGCNDPDAETRRAIEAAEGRFARTPMSFLEGFTTQGGLGEKVHRLRDAPGPSDQPVIYASAMLRLRREHGGDAWVRRFFRALDLCPEIKQDTPEGALRQGLIWMLAASTAAGRDLSDDFVGRWHLPLGPSARKALASVDWNNADPSAVLETIPADLGR